MPSPNLSELVTTTLRDRSPKTADAVTRNNALLTRLKSRGMSKKVAGGRSLVRPIEYAMNSTYQRYTGYETLNIAPQDIFTAAEYPWRQTAVAVSISGLEELMNNGKAAVIDLLGGRVRNAERSMANGISYDLYSAGQLPMQMTGLQAIISTTPASGTLGGINAATWAFWQNIAGTGAGFNGGTSTTSANILNSMNQMILPLVRGPDGVDMIIADNTMYAYFGAALQSIQRITSPDRGEAGFPALSYSFGGKLIDVVLDGGFQGYSTDPVPVGGAPTGTMYFINTNYLEFCTHSDRDMVPVGGDRMSVNQDAMVRLIGWAGNLCCTWRRAHGVLTA